MIPLIKVIDSHVRGVSGMDNPMMSRTIVEELPALHKLHIRQLHGMLFTYSLSLDEDEVRVAEWVLGEISHR